VSGGSLLFIIKGFLHALSLAIVFFFYYFAVSFFFPWILFLFLLASWGRLLSWDSLCRENKHIYMD